MKNDVEKYSDGLRRLADLLDEDFKGNIKKVAIELIKILGSISKYEMDSKYENRARNYRRDRTA